MLWFHAELPFQSVAIHNHLYHTALSSKNQVFLRLPHILDGVDANNKKLPFSTDAKRFSVCQKREKMYLKNKRIVTKLSTSAAPLMTFSIQSALSKGAPDATSRCRAGCNVTLLAEAFVFVHEGVCLAEKDRLIRFVAEGNAAEREAHRFFLSVKGGM